MIDRRVLAYLSIPLVFYIIYFLVNAKEWVIVSILTVIYLGFVFGIDRVKFDLKNKKIEFRDDDKS